MSKVHLLPSEVISKIAAGEVIERPASVVKELVENSIDAGATSIEVRLEDAGKKSIFIKDNGHGIERDDLEKIFSRHATSKLKNADDLFAIMSLGFRGEALYSIGSIADVILRSKTKNQQEAWELHIRGGERISLKPCALSGNGTEIEVRELFYNTPARKKFLKANTSENYQTLNTFIPYTLLHKEIRFSFSHQDRTLVDLAPTKNLVERLASALSLDKKHILESKQFKKDDCEVYLVCGDINLRRNRRDMQFIFINGRPVQNKNLSYHLNQVFRLVMPPEFFPFFSVYLTLPATDIDVNIHPTKREVKMKNETSVCAILRSLCEELLMRTGEIKNVAHKTQDVEIPQALKRSNLYQETLDYSSILEKSSGSGDSSRDVTTQYTYPQQPEYNFFIPDADSFPQNQNNLAQQLKNARYVGSFISKYLIFENDRALLLVDQHAAQERIVYERLIDDMQKGTLEIQPLLSPILIKVTTQEIMIWEELKDKFDEVGLQSNQWDKETIAIHSQPVLLKDVEKAVRELLLEGNIAQSDFDTIARRACRASIMTGDRLTKEQAEYQRQELIACLDPFTCPHGRPTILKLTEDFLDKQFLRKK